MYGTQVPPLPTALWGLRGHCFFIFRTENEPARLEETVEVKLYRTLSYSSSCMEYFGIFTDFTSWNFLSAQQIGGIVVDRIAMDSFRGHYQEWTVFSESYDGIIEFASTWPASGINWGNMSAPPLSTRIMNEGPFLVSMEHENLCVITIPTISIPNYAWWLIREHSLDSRRKKSFYSVLMVIEYTLWVFSMSYFNW